MNVDRAHQFLADLEMFGVKLGLEQTSELFDLIGDPRPKLRFIHLAGTNGKGSVAVMLTAALRAAGLKTGLYTSPHLMSPRERFRIDGVAVDDATLAAAVAALEPRVEAMRARGRAPTYFEATTALAAMIFADAGVDVAVWETGMGGRLDATNVVTPICSIITGVALDHQTHLGDDLQRIAREKAGIVKPSVPVFAGRLPEVAERIVRQRCANLAAPFFPLPRRSKVARRETVFDGDVFRQRFTLGKRFIHLSMGARAQAENAELAVTVLEWFAEREGFDLERAIEGLAAIRWPGRFQPLRDGRWLLDGAHNPQGTAALTAFVKERFPGKRFPVLFAHFADKNARECLSILSPVAERFVLVPIHAGKRRSSSPEELAKTLSETAPQFDVEIHPSAAKALAKERESNLLIAGSLFLAGDVLRWLNLDADAVLVKA